MGPIHFEHVGFLIHSFRGVQDTLSTGGVFKKSKYQSNERCSPSPLSASFELSSLRMMFVSSPKPRQNLSSARERLSVSFWRFLSSSEIGRYSLYDH